MRPGVSLFARFPEIESSPHVKAALTNHQTCQYCSRYPQLETSFDCPKRRKTVSKRTGIRLFCFDPITDAQLAENTALISERDRVIKLEYSRALSKKNPLYYRAAKVRYNMRHPRILENNDPSS